MKARNQTRTILIVDGSHIVLTLAQDALEKAGYRVLTHQNPTGCLTRIILEKPDLVLIDVSMPALSGDTIVKLLGSAKPKSNAIVLLHSSLHEAELKERTQSSGADGYVRKSSNQEALVREVDKWMARLRVSDSDVLATLPPSRPNSDLVVTDTTSDAAEERSVNVPSILDRDAPLASVNIEEASDTRSTSLLGDRAHSGVRLALPTVLFVDDEMITLSTYRRSFQSDEFVSEFSLSGSQALTRINSARPPAAIVCDVMMPNTDGVALFSQAVAIDPSWRRRIVFVTGAVGAGSLRLSLDHFEGSILKKPFSVDELRRAIQHCLLNARVLLPKTQNG